MKIFHFCSILLIAIFSNHQSFSQNSKTKSGYKVTATYTPYHTAMGKGRGIIFKINISNKNKKAFTIDSFFVNNKPMKFIVNQNKEGVNIESNYLVNTTEPSLNQDGTINKPKEIEDEIITQNHFYPSWIVITVKEKKMKIKISKYTLIPEKEHS